jgi:hypothetical protein
MNLAHTRSISLHLEYEIIRGLRIIICGRQSKSYQLLGNNLTRVSFLDRLLNLLILCDAMGGHPVIHGLA